MLPVTLYCHYGFLTMQKQVILSDVSYSVFTHNQLKWAQFGEADIVQSDWNC